LRENSFTIFPRVFLFLFFRVSCFSISLLLSKWVRAPLPLLSVRPSALAAFPKKVVVKTNFFEMALAPKKGNWLSHLSGRKEGRTSPFGECRTAVNDDFNKSLKTHVLATASQKIA
jgi:hypothetical protein